MGRRGPQRKPDSTRAPARAKAAEAAHAVADELRLDTIPPAPDGLAEAAAVAWGKFARLAFDTGRLTRADLPALEMLAITWVEWQACAAIANDPTQAWVKSQQGGLYQHPAVGQASAARKMVTAIMAKFGLTPMDRVNVGGSGTPAKKQGSGLAAFAASRSG